MKKSRIVAALALTTVLAALAPSIAAGSSSLSGTYQTTVTSAGSLNGTYKISFSPGRFTLKAPYNITGHGTYSISGSSITLHGPDKECTAAGRYTFSRSGSSLSFRKISDPCKRAKILTAHSLKKV
jgi:hypothetical protein